MLPRLQFARHALLSAFAFFPSLRSTRMPDPLLRRCGRPREPISPAPLHSMSAPSSFLRWSFSSPSGPARDNHLETSPRPGFSESSLSQGVRPTLRRPPRRIVRGALLLARPISALLESGPRFRCPSFLCLDALRAPTDRISPPGVPHSPSALWACHPHPIQEPQAEEFPCALSARDDMSTIP